MKNNVAIMKDKYADTVTKAVDIDQDILAEYLAQRKYLEKSVDMLKQNLNKDQMIHKQDNFRIMKDNVQLIKQINLLRQEIKNIQLGAKSPESNKEMKSPALKTWKEGMIRPTILPEEISSHLAEKKKIIGKRFFLIILKIVLEHQKFQIKQLKEKLHDLSQHHDMTTM